MNAPWRSLGLATVLLAGLTAYTDVAAQPVYRWVDADGNVHFSDQPPPEGGPQAEEVRLRPDISADRAEAARQNLSEAEQRLYSNRAARSQQSAQAAAQAAEDQRMNQAREQLCAQARRSLQTLVDQGPVFQMNAAGEREYLEDSQRDAEIARYRQVVARACQ